MPAILIIENASIIIRLPVDVFAFCLARLSNMSIFFPQKREARHTLEKYVNKRITMKVISGLCSVAFYYVARDI